MKQVGRLLKRAYQQENRQYFEVPIMPSYFYQHAEYHSPGYFGRQKFWKQPAKIGAERYNFWEKRVAKRKSCSNQKWIFRANQKVEIYGRFEYWGRHDQSRYCEY